MKETQQNKAPKPRKYWVSQAQHQPTQYATYGVSSIVIATPPPSTAEFQNSHQSA